MSSSSSSSKLTSNTYDAFHDRLTSLALTSTRASTALPNERDLSFYKTLDPEFKKDVESVSQRLLGLTSRLLDYSDRNANGKGKGKAKMTEDDMVRNFDKSVVDVVDGLLERTDMAIDTLLGRRKEPAIYVNPKAPAVHGKSNTRQAPTGSSTLVKPQLKFKPRPTSPAPSLLPKKVAYPEWMFARSEPVRPKSFEDTPFTFVSTMEEYKTMVEQLKGEKEIAIDLEHHDYRTYAGFLCLMQISTRDQDWVVDILDPDIRLEMEEGKEMRAIFDDPNVVKVFHGAEHDVMWLQRDFNLRITNLFDTFHASKILEFPSHSLSTLMQMYCSITPDKSLQTADWRIRPLPQNMLMYARGDTHWLLYIYDEVRNALLDRGGSSQRSPTSSREASPGSASSMTSTSSYPGKRPTRLLRDALRRSHATASKVYASTKGSPDALAKKWNKPLLIAAKDGQEEIQLAQVVRMQRAVYHALFQWREKVAEEEDESIRYVMPNHFLFSLSSTPPASLADLNRSIGSQATSTILKRRTEELLKVIKEAVKRGLEDVASSKPQSTPVAASVTVARTSSLSGVSTTETLQVSTSAAKLPAADLQTIWGQTMVKTDNGAVAASSALFGSKKPSISAAPPRSTIGVVKAAVSSLFGKGKSSESASMNVDSAEATFADIVSRIHSSLTVLPTTAPSSTADNSADAAMDATPPAENPDTFSGMQVEIPYVPPSERTTTTAPLDEFGGADGIVMVGKTQPGGGKKKRKRPTPGGGGEEVKPFDFGSVPNILDVNAPEEGAGREKKKKKRWTKEEKKERARTVPGEFRRPHPGSSREVRAGNVSHTFR